MSTASTGMATRNRTAQGSPVTVRAGVADCMVNPTAPARITPRNTQDLSFGHASPQTAASSSAHGIGTIDRMTMNVSTPVARITALPDAQVITNIAAAGKKATARSPSRGGQDRGSRKVVHRAKTAEQKNWRVVRSHRYPPLSWLAAVKELSAHLLTTTIPATEVACPATKKATQPAVGLAAALATPSSSSWSINVHAASLALPAVY
mmetsp:Transcript_654/g.1314  ORF Transcript_654/g.1314 Transcript_654/m.1314 type:complete len:207 (-) Transcript_654:67-687(-)